MQRKTGNEVAMISDCCEGVMVGCITFSERLRKQQHCSLWCHQIVLQVLYVLSCSTVPVLFQIVVLCSSVFGGGTRKLSQIFLTRQLPLTASSFKLTAVGIRDCRRLEANAHVVARSK